MKTTIWKPLVTGVLALAVISTTTGASLPTTTEPQPNAAVTTQNKQASVVWKYLDNTINKRSLSLGMSGYIAYTAPTGATGAVTLTVSRLKPGTTTWAVVSKITIDQAKTSYNLTVQDANQGLSSGTVKYRVEAVAPVGTNIALPADFTVDYTKTVTTVASNNLAGKTLTTDSLYPFKATGKINGSTSREMYLQKYDPAKKTWVNVSFTYAFPSKAYSLSLPQTKATETYRTYSPANLTSAAYTGASTVVKRTSTKGGFYSQSIKKSRIVPWETNSAYVYVASRLVTGEAAPKVTLQENIKGRWVNIQALKKQGRLTFTLPKGNTSSANTAKTYRYVVNATRFADAAISKTFTVRWDNPRKYAGTRLTAYNYASKYCPNMMIDIKPLPTGIAGLAYMGSGVTALSPIILARDLRTVSLHECAHHRQWALNSSNWNGFKTKMDKLYNIKTGKGLEHNADCIANVWHRNTYWGYGRVCTGEQLTAAKVMASGRKY